MAPGILVLVSIPCPSEPDMRFFLTRSGALRQPSTSLAFAMRDRLGSLFSLSGQHVGAASLALSLSKGSLYFTGCCFALPSQEGTTLRHNQSPSHIGRLLSGGLTLTRAGLPPASRARPELVEGMTFRDTPRCVRHICR